MRTIVKLKVGSKGEIYTTKEIRKILGIEGAREVIAVITKDGLLIKPRRSIEDLLKKRGVKIEITVEEFEKLSEEIQEEILK